MAVAMVSAECCLDYGECTEMCFSSMPKPENVKSFSAAIFFHKMLWKCTEKLQKHTVQRLATGHGENSLDFLGVICILEYGLISPQHFFHNLLYLKQLLLNMMPNSVIGS